MKRKILSKFSILILSLVLCFLALLGMKTNFMVCANFETNVSHKSSVLIEYETGKILVDKSSDK